MLDDLVRADNLMIEFGEEVRLIAKKEKGNLVLLYERVDPTRA